MGMSNAKPWVQTRRDFVTHAAGTAGAGAMWIAGGPVAAARDLGKARTVSIFHTTDLHGRILPTSSYEGLDDVGGFVGEMGPQPAARGRSAAQWSVEAWGDGGGGGGSAGQAARQAARPEDGRAVSDGADGGAIDVAELVAVQRA